MFRATSITPMPLRKRHHCVKMTETVEAIFFVEAVLLYSSLLQHCIKLINERDDL
jgi:hypothetical protein